MTIERRRFLAATAAATAAGFTLPGWLSRAFGQDHVALDPVVPGTLPPRVPTTSLATLSAAYRDAQRLGKPLLVLVVPESEQSESYWNRPQAFGELLNHGGDDAMIALAMTHVACATPSELRQLVPTAPPGEPLMVLVETDRVPAVARAIDPTLDFHRVDMDEVQVPRHGRRPETWEERQARADRVIDGRIAAMTTALVAAVAPDAQSLAARAAVARAHADAQTLAAVTRAVQGGPPVDGPVADRAAAVLALAAEGAPAAVRQSLRQSLVKGADARLRDARVPGSMWARGGGCGTTVEGVEENVMMGCGMGFMPERSSRFLFFYTRAY